MPAYPHLCLWPESVKMLYALFGALPAPRFIPDWDKRRLDLGKPGPRVSRAALFRRRPFTYWAIVAAIRLPMWRVMRPQSALLSLVADHFSHTLAF